MRHFVTGSHVFGVPTSNSDVDIAMSAKDAYNLREYLYEHRIYNIKANYEGSVSFKIDLIGLVINVIGLTTDEEYEAWEKATTAMRKMDPIKDRSIRLGIFKALRGES